jgi:hypothetical protein
MRVVQGRGAGSEGKDVFDLENSCGWGRKGLSQGALSRMGWGFWKETLQAARQVLCRAVRPLSIEPSGGSLPGQPLIELNVVAVLVEVFVEEDPLLRIGPVRWSSGTWTTTPVALVVRQ